MTPPEENKYGVPLKAVASLFRMRIGELETLLNKNDLNKRKRRKINGRTQIYLPHEYLSIIEKHRRYSAA